jgi:hypothetical protein
VVHSLSRTYAAGFRVQPVTTSAEKFAEADRLRKQADQLNKEGHEQHRQELLQKPLAQRLIFAAWNRCPCGAGLAYDPAFEHQGRYWDCSAILLGTAIASGQPGAVTHTDQLPFAFYEVKSENQPSANGATTRGPT